MQNRLKQALLALTIGLIAVLTTGVRAAPAGLDPTLLVQIAVEDLDRSVEFYTETLGFELESVDRELQWARVKTGIDGVTIGIGQQETVKGSGTVSMNFGVEDVDSYRGALEAKGVRFEGPTITVPGVVRLATLHDPDGNRIRLATDLKPGDQAPASAPEPAPVRIEDLAFIAGTWRGELFGANADERWSQPEANHMVGLFRMWNANGPTLYEILEFVETTEDGQPQVHFRFKHINAIKLDQWENDKPLEFVCTEADDNRAVFTATSDEQLAVTNMIYHREGGTLRVTVHGVHDSGEAFAFTAEYQRAGG